MPNFMRFEEQTFPAGQARLAGPYGGAVPGLFGSPGAGGSGGGIHLSGGGTPGTGSAPVCPPLPRNPRLGQPGVNDPYFGTQADHDAWAAANPACPPPAFMPDSVQNTVTLSVTAPTGGMIPADISVSVDSGSPISPDSIPIDSSYTSGISPLPASRTYTLSLPDGQHTVTISSTTVAPGSASGALPATVSGNNVMFSVSGGQTAALNVGLKSTATAAAPGTAGYPTGYPQGPVFGDQSDPCAAQFVTFLQANPSKYQNPAVAPQFNNPAAQAIGRAHGMTCSVWNGMSVMARRQWVALRRFGNVAYANHPQVGTLVDRMNVSCVGVRPAGQTAGGQGTGIIPATMPLPAWTDAAYSDFANANPACALWAQTAMTQYHVYLSSAASGGLTGGAPASPSGGIGKVLLIGGVVVVGLWALSKYGGSDDGETAEEPAQPSSPSSSTASGAA